MSYADAIQSFVSVRAAMRELGAHGFNACVVGDCLMAGDGFSPMEKVAELCNGMVSGAEVLGWLGY